MNWWLMLLSALLGFGLTWLWMVRRVTREVPRARAVSRGAIVSVAAPPADADGPQPDGIHPGGPDPGELRTSAATIGALAARDKTVEEPVVEHAGESTVQETDEDGPYGPGSASAGADGSGPEGWLVKGNADSMLFHTPESPGYGRTMTVVWFRDEASAASAGFQHWDRKRRGHLIELPQN